MKNQPIVTINHFIKLLILKNKPQDLNYSIFMLGILLLSLFLLTNQITANISIKNLPTEIKKIDSLVTLIVILHETIFLLFLQRLLKLNHKVNRFVQAASNFIGIDLIECLLATTISSFTLGFYLLCALKAWFLVIKFHITKHAFNVNNLKAAGLFFMLNIAAIFTTMFAMTAIMAIFR